MQRKMKPLRLAPQKLVNRKTILRISNGNGTWLFLKDGRYNLPLTYSNWSKARTVKMTTWKCEKPTWRNQSPTLLILKENMGQFCPNPFVEPTTQVRYRARVTWSGYISRATVTPPLLTEDSKPRLKPVSMNISLSLDMYVLNRIKCFSSVYLAVCVPVEFPCELERLFGDQNHAKYTLL